ncbi:TPA: hypothetical protein DIV55_02490 [Patescibacteria group bacterium]|nr:hypothetical protein [Patescibacteria group bacterium]
MSVSVIDASFVLQALLGNENKAHSFHKLFLDSKTSVHAPTILGYEVTNGLRFTLKDSLLASQVLQKFAELPIQYFSFTGLQLKQIMELSYTLQTTAYDTSYHFLAHILNGIFYTCDKDYFDKAKHLPGIKFVGE